MSNLYSEDQLIEQTCIDIFKNQLHWEIANVYQGETFGENGTIGRASEADVLLKNRFYKAIKKNIISIFSDKTGCSKCVK